MAEWGGSSGTEWLSNSTSITLCISSCPHHVSAQAPPSENTHTIRVCMCSLCPLEQGPCLSCRGSEVLAHMHFLPLFHLGFSEGCDGGWNMETLLFFKSTFYRYLTKSDFGLYNPWLKEKTMPVKINLFAWRCPSCSPASWGYSRLKLEPSFLALKWETTSEGRSWIGPAGGY